MDTVLLRTVIFLRGIVPHCVSVAALVRRSTMRERTSTYLIHPGSVRIGRAILLKLCLLTLVVCTCPLHALAASSVKPESIPTTLAEKGKNLSAMKAVMTVTTSYEGEKSSQDFKGFLLYRRPSDFRFQGLAPGGNSLFELVIKADAFELYVPQEGKILKGSKSCFSRRFPDVAEIEGLIPLMLLQWRNANFQKLLSVDSEKILIRVKFEGRLWGVTLDAKDLYVKRLERLNADGEIDLAADFGDFKTGEYGWLPRRFAVKSPLGNWKTLVKIGRIEINPFLVEKNFVLEPTFSPKIENCR